MTESRPDYPGYFPTTTPPVVPAAPTAPPGPYGPRPHPASRRTVLVAAVIAAVIGGGIGAGTYALTDHNTNHAGLIFNGKAAPAPALDGSISAAAAKIGPSVVTINVTSSQESDTGSGVIIRSDGYILTNNHVISAAVGSSGSSSAASSISVTLADGRQSSATVVGYDSSDDLAVIKIKLSDLTAAQFASSSALVVGQTVVAVGAPLGLSDTVTSGIVSTIARPVTTGDSSSGTDSTAIFDAVQTDAAINPGNSGGPLVNLNGAVVGINAAIATAPDSGGLQVPGQSSSSGNIGIGFAIPSDEASRIAAELITSGKATHALLGVGVEDATSTGSSGSSSGTVGAVIKTVVSGGPGGKAGLKAGDVVTELAGQRIDSADALVAAVRSHAPNSSVSLTYLRDGASKTVSVTLGSQSS